MNGFAFALPEIVFAGFILASILFCAFGGKRSGAGVYALSYAAVASAAFLLLSGKDGEAFSAMFVADGFTRIAKLAVLAFSAFSLSLLGDQKDGKPENALLLMLSALGSMVLLSANDFMSLYVAAELQSIPMYVLAASGRGAKRAEAGVKYFVLGALSSCVMIYGISLLYGACGSVYFSEVADKLNVDCGALAGVAMIAAAMAFKISAAPFHMWTPDVYEGAASPVVAFISSVPKIASFALLARMQSVAFAGIWPQWMPIVVFLSVVSMAVGGIGGLAQKNVKRILAYGAVSNAGFALIGLAAGKAEAALAYIIIYSVASAGSFAALSGVRRDGREAEQLSDLTGFSKARPAYAAAMAIFMFSMAGIPPMAGFFGKYFVLAKAMEAGFLPLALAGVLFSVVSATYYLRVIKAMYFDEQGEEGGFSVSSFYPVMLAAAITALFAFLASVLPEHISLSVA